MQSYILKSQ